MTDHERTTMPDLNTPPPLDPDCLAGKHHGCHVAVSAPTGLTGDLTAALNRIAAALEAIAAALASKGDEPREAQTDALVERADDVGVPTAHHITGFRRTP